MLRTLPTLVTSQKVGEVTIAVIHSATLDRSNSTQFNPFLPELTGPDAQIVLDLSRVEWMDSDGCCILIVLLKRLKETNGELKLCGLTRPVRKLLELISLHKLVEIFNSVDEAVRAFQI